MVTPAQRIDDLGGFHDAKVKALEFRLSQKSILITLDDFYANFRGDPEYTYASGTVFFQSVQVLEVVLEDKDPGILTVYEIQVYDGADAVRFEIRLAPSGRITGIAKSVSVTETREDIFRH